MYKVLLVDDEPLVLIGIKNILDWQSEECICIASATSGTEALQAVMADEPDIIIADINMPAMSGIELLRRTNEINPNIVFIMLTNLQDFDLAVKSLRFRAIDYLLKTKLDAKTLSDSLKNAKEESDSRRNSMAPSENRKAAKRKLPEDLPEILLTMPLIPEEITELLAYTGVTDAFSLVCVQFFPNTQVHDEKKSPRMK